MDMDRKQKELLYQSAMSILQNAAISDVMALNAVVAGDMVLRRALLDRVVDHVKDQLHMELNEWFTFTNSHVLLMFPQQL